MYFTGIVLYICIITEFAEPFLKLISNHKSQIQALPPECDPYIILLKEEESCLKELWKHNTSVSVDFQTGMCIKTLLRTVSPLK